MSPPRRYPDKRTHRPPRHREHAIRFLVVIDGLGIVLLGIAGAFLVPILPGLYFGEDWATLVDAFVVPFILCAGIGLALRYGTPDLYGRLRPGEAMVMVSLAWLVIAVLGAVPYVGVASSPEDAFFESMSGFTSTGATVLTGLDAMPKSILLWRALTQWLGGMGVIVLSVAVLSRFFGGGAKPMLVQAEVPGHHVTRMAPRMAQTARLLWGIYILLTVLEVVMLLLVGNIGDGRMSAFDAVCHAFTTLPGGGFGTHDANAGHWDSPGVEFILMVFMIAGATSFVLHHQALHMNVRAYLKDPEFRLFILMICLATVIISGDLASKGIYDVGHSLRVGSFHVVSIMTTTGYTTTNYDMWPEGSRILLLMLMLMGGCLGSTSGALKVTRVMVVLKGVRMLMMKAMHRQGVFHVRIGTSTLNDEQVANTVLYVILYLGIIGLGTLLLSFEEVGLVTAVSATITCIGNVGPGLALVGPATTFASLSAAAKLTLSLVMWLGRLEILGCLLLFSPTALRE